MAPGLNLVNSKKAFANQIVQRVDVNHFFNSGYYFEPSYFEEGFEIISYNDLVKEPYFLTEVDPNNYDSDYLKYSVFLGRWVGGNGAPAWVFASSNTASRFSVIYHNAGTLKNIEDASFSLEVDILAEYHDLVMGLHDPMVIQLCPIFPYGQAQRLKSSKVTFTLLKKGTSEPVHIPSFHIVCTSVNGSGEAIGIDKECVNNIYLLPEEGPYPCVLKDISSNYSNMYAYQGWDNPNFSDELGSLESLVYSVGFELNLSESPNFTLMRISGENGASWTTNSFCPLTSVVPLPPYKKFTITR